MYHSLINFINNPDNNPYNNPDNNIEKINNSEENDYQQIIIKNINKEFKIPIYYNKKKQQLSKNIIDDLELVKTIDSSNIPIYNYLFNNTNILSSEINNQIVQYYTTDIKFLKDYQKLLKTYNPINKPIKINHANKNEYYSKIINLVNELKIQEGFLDKYNYIDWDLFEFLNKSEFFLQFLSIYNLLSPIISLFIPIIILIIPFFILKLRGITITLNEYYDVLKAIALQNAIGKLFFTNFNNINLQDKFYIFISAFFYLFSIYQNINICIKFYSNMKIIHNYFEEIKNYLKNTIISLENYLNYTSNLDSHREFTINASNKLDSLKLLLSKINKITEFKRFNILKLTEIGYILKLFYELHKDEHYSSLIYYSLGFNGYIDNLDSLLENIREKNINFCKFTKKLNSISFKNIIYPTLINNHYTSIKNNVKFNKNIIITGPNASGKTTILKALLINIIFSQQFGCGSYETKTIIKPFKYLHCYLNIPDTSGRDSLFQAEARRCKEILNTINDNTNKEQHFCAFDELYSGTNPHEAILSSYSFINYINKKKNVFFVLTTHFRELCEKLNESKDLINYKMKTTENNNTLIYHYKLEKGISNINGGLNILKQLDYPIEIIENK